MESVWQLGDGAAERVMMGGVAAWWWCSRVGHGGTCGSLVVVQQSGSW